MSKFIFVRSAAARSVSTHFTPCCRSHALQHMSRIDSVFDSLYAGTRLSSSYLNVRVFRHATLVTPWGKSHGQIQVQRRSFRLISMLGHSVLIMPTLLAAMVIVEEITQFVHRVLLE